MMLVARATWNIRGDQLPEAADQMFFEEHLPIVRALPGLRVHAALRFLSGARGASPRWWRGEELTFDDPASLVAAAPRWTDLWNRGLGPLVAGPRIDVFELEDEFLRADPPPDPGVGPPAMLSGIWQVPARLTPADVDGVYRDVHVPNVRRLPGLRRHRALKAVEWPPGEHSRAWRAAEIRYDSLADFEAVYSTPEYEAIRQDGFNASVAGPDVDIYVADDEWHR
jgi:uncharacterized protein (TIGR02118 family)